MKSLVILMLKEKINQLRRINHPQHAILAVAMIGIGLILVCNDYYFFWPPFAVGFLNDDLTGGIFIAVGIWLFSWAVSNKNKIATNRNLLVVTAGLLAFESVSEFIHGSISGQPHVAIAVRSTLDRATAHDYGWFPGIYCIDV